ncbi:MAG TPA: hypothetical protein VIM89_11130 [Mucilaginibacter sp.]
MKTFIVLAFCLIIGMSSFQHPTTGISSMPKGTILGWGSKGNIPYGWVVCNGANGTPDLVGRFPYGTSNSSEIGDKLGKPDHSHSVSGTTDIPDDLVNYNGDNRALEKNGGSRVHHTHHFSAKTSTESLIPPATKIIFIMKIR